MLQSMTSVSCVKLRINGDSRLWIWSGGLNFNLLGVVQTREAPKALSSSFESHPHSPTTGPSSTHVQRWSGPDGEIRIIVHTLAQFSNYNTQQNIAHHWAAVPQWSLERILSLELQKTVCPPPLSESDMIS